MTDNVKTIPNALPVGRDQVEAMAPDRARDEAGSG
jgi:hypothetical protein